MNELVPVLLGAVAGVMLCLGASGKPRFGPGVVAVVLSGGVSTVASGEYLQNWTYLLLDIGEAAAGAAIGCLAAAALHGVNAGRHAIRHDTP